MNIKNREFFAITTVFIGLFLLWFVAFLFLFFAIVHANYYYIFYFAFTILGSIIAYPEWRKFCAKLFNTYI